MLQENRRLKAKENVRDRK